MHGRGLFIAHSLVRESVYAELLATEQRAGGDALVAAELGAAHRRLAFTAGAAYAITYERMPPREWNAASYDRQSDPQLAMARDVIDRLDLRGDERVLDAGCGTGRVTQELVERVPNGTVIAVDGSSAMVEQARERLGDDVEAFAQDLLDLQLDHPVDAILSTATFHWIADHERLFERLYAALSPGGRLSAQCGGEGNIANVQRAIDAVDHSALRGWAGPWNYADPRTTKQRLERAGFKDVWTWLQPWPVEPPDPREYFATIILGSHLERLPLDEQMPFVDDVLAEMAQPVRANYVRLNILARRA